MWCFWLGLDRPKRRDARSRSKYLSRMATHGMQYPGPPPNNTLFATSLFRLVIPRSDDMEVVLAEHRLSASYSLPISRLRPPTRLRQPQGQSDYYHSRHCTRIQTLHSVLLRTFIRPKQLRYYKSQFALSQHSSAFKQANRFYPAPHPRVSLYSDPTQCKLSFVTPRNTIL